MFRSRCFREIPALITNRLESNARGTIAAMIWGGEWQRTNERFSRLAFGPRTRLLWRQLGLVAMDLAWDRVRDD